jgi:hypothetical protein
VRLTNSEEQPITQGLTMRVTITDLVTGTCDLTRKQNAECVRVQLDDGSELLCVPSELIKQIRLRKKQDNNRLPAEKKGP